MYGKQLFQLFKYLHTQYQPFFSRICILAIAMSTCSQNLTLVEIWDFSHHWYNTKNRMHPYISCLVICQQHQLSTSLTLTVIITSANNDH